MIINLETGQLEEAAPAPDAAPSQLGPGKIIDMESGALVDDMPAQSFGHMSPQDIDKERRARIDALPEAHESGLLAGKDIAKMAKIMPVLLLTTDPGEFADIVATTFPEIGKTQTPEGEIILTDNQTGVSTIVNKQGVSPMDFIQGAGLVSAFTLPGGAATIPARIAGATGLEAGLQATQAATGGEFNPGDVVMAGGLGVVGEAVGPIAQTLRQGRQARELGVSGEDLVRKVAPTEEAAEQAVSGLKETTGESVGLFPAQKTLIPSEIQKQRVLPQLEAGSRKAFEALSKQNEEVFDATTSLIDRIVPRGQAVNAEKRFRDAAQQFEKILKNQREQAFSAEFGPALQKAANDNLIINSGQTESLIKSMKIGHRPGSPISKLMDELNAGLKEASEELVDGSNMMALHSFKREISQKVAGFEKKTGPLDEDLKRDVSMLYDSLTKSIRGSSDEYGRAMDVFIQKTPEIEAFQSSLSGRIMNLSDSELLDVTAKIFDRRVMPEEIVSARKVIESVDPGAWSAIVSKEINNRVGGIVSFVADQGADAVPNMPGQLKSAIFGNPRQREVLFRSLNSEQKQNFRFLETVLSRASAGRSQGSPTASFSEIIKNLRGRLGVLKDVFTRPLQTVQETGDVTLFDRRVNALTSAMFDTKWSTEMKKIRNMPSTSETASRAMLQLLNDVEQTEEQ